MIRTQISFDESLYERAKRAAKRRGISCDANDSSSVDDVVYGRESP